MTDTVTAPSLFANTEYEDDIETRFHDFDQRHPEVFAAISRIALRRLDSGAKRLSMKWIAEIVRSGDWRGDQNSPVKFNNDFTALYTRKLVAKYPELACLFHTRRRTTASVLSATQGQGSSVG